LDGVTEQIEIKTENPTLRNHGLITGWRILLFLSKCMKTIVGSDEIGRLICTVSRKRSNQTELRAYRQTVVVSILMAAGDSGNVWSQVDWVSRRGRPWYPLSRGG
jgi:hypothetical protein